MFKYAVESGNVTLNKTALLDSFKFLDSSEIGKDFEHRTAMYNGSEVILDMLQHFIADSRKQLQLNFKVQLTSSSLTTRIEYSDFLSLQKSITSLAEATNNSALITYIFNKPSNLYNFCNALDKQKQRD